MSGLTGWFGPHYAADEARAVLDAAARPLSTFDHSEAKSALGPRWGIAVSGTAQSTLLYQEGHITLAIYGHPLWSGVGAEGISAAIVAAYRAWGEAFLHQLKGDFALCLIDNEKQETLLAVDRMGVRPLIYASQSDRLIFGSRCECLLAQSPQTTALNRQALLDYLYYHMVPGTETVYAGFKRLPPGYVLRQRGGAITLSAYWTPMFEESGRGDVADYRDEFLNLLRAGVARQAHSSKPGAFLSGGTDSSTISGLLGQVSGSAAHTYSIGFDAAGYDEMEYARLAAKHFNTDHHEYYVTPDDVVTAIPRIAAMYDQPFGNASAVPTYYCAAMAQADGVTRLLGGDGGDELFGGNTRYASQHIFSLYEKIPSALRKGLIEPATQFLPEGFPLIRKARSYIQQASVPMPDRYESYNLLNRLGMTTILTDDFLNAIDPDGPMHLMRSIYHGAHAKTMLNRMLALDFRFTLTDNDLPKVTRMCELAGVDVAFPMLDDALLDFSLRLPPRLKLKGTQLRYFFKAALSDLLPKEIITKEKHGFGLPFGVWLQTHKPLQQLALDSLSSLKSRGIIRPEFIDQLTDQHLSSHAGYYGTMVWVLMMLEQWFTRQGQHT